MVKVSKDVAEKKFQQDFVEELEKYRWEAPDELNGNTHKVTVQDLIDNWRHQLNRINADQLEGVELTDNEFEQVLSKVKGINNSYEAAKLLSIENNTGKIDGIYRDDNPEITRKQITLTIFKKSQVSGGDSSYQIAREISTDNNNRFDIVLLINGLPLINIEQKRTDKNLDEAFGQFKRYYHDGEYRNNFMAFSQMMVMVSEIEMRYFATPKSESDFNPSFVFHWADYKNKVINEWHQVIKQFLMIPMAHQMVGDYLVIDEANDEENRRHMLMRPYQVHALQAIEAAALGRDNKCGGRPHGGFIWHTTGSGKTITSFKTALFLSTRLNFDKVVFMVDRKELDNNTSKSFKAYSAYDSVDVDSTNTTDQLRLKLQSKKNGIVVTTTYKLANLVKELEFKKDYKLAEKRMIFIVDEAQRTTMGQMMVSIKEYFRKNGLFYGFTGTPLFKENKVRGMILEHGNKSELINTTEKLFGPELHRYTIDEAINDGNVLGFNVDYINTGEFKNYDSLKEKLIKKLYGDEPTIDQERSIKSLSDLDAEKEAFNNNVLEYQDETHIPRVVENILKHWEKHSHNRQFNAILTVAYKDRVIEYYKEFKKQLNNQKRSLNIAMTFSFGNENDPKNIVSNDIKEMMFKDYSEFTGIEFISGDKRNGEDAYFEDLIERTKRGGSGRNSKNIDLVIVADQLLTGYDSKLLNTLYVDRHLELQGLIQAYSRTNRVYGEGKEFGSIINFEYPNLTKEAVNTALKLYGSGGDSSSVIVDDYKIAVSKFKKKIVQMRKTLENPSDWYELKEDRKRLQKFITKYRDSSKQYNRLLQYYCFEWDDESFGISEDEWMRYKGAYINIISTTGTPSESESITDLEGETTIQDTQRIDAQYILELIGNTDNGGDTLSNEKLQLIYKKIKEFSDMGNYQKAELLRRFVKEISSSKIPENVSIGKAFDDWKNRLYNKEVENTAEYWGVDPSVLSESLGKYSVSTPKTVPLMYKILKSASYEKATNKDAGKKEYIFKLSEFLPEWMNKTKKEFN